MLPAFVAPDDSGCAHSHRGRNEAGLYDVVISCCAWWSSGACFGSVGYVDDVDSATGFQTTFMGSLSQQLGRRWHDLSPFLVLTRKVKVLPPTPKGNARFDT